MNEKENEKKFDYVAMAAYSDLYIENQRINALSKLLFEKGVISKEDYDRIIEASPSRQFGYGTNSKK